MSSFDRFSTLGVVVFLLLFSLQSKHASCLSYSKLFKFALNQTEIVRVIDALAQAVSIQVNQNCFFQCKDGLEDGEREREKERKKEKEVGHLEPVFFSLVEFCLREPLKKEVQTSFCKRSSIRVYHGRWCIVWCVSLYNT